MADRRRHHLAWAPAPGGSWLAGCPRPPPRLDYESHAVALDRDELGALLVTAGLRVSGASSADIEHLGLAIF